jgi:hypothetical protein
MPTPFSFTFPAYLTCPLFFYLYSKAVIDNQPVSNIKLSIVHHYDLEQFAQAIEDRMSVKTVAR